MSKRTLSVISVILALLFALTLVSCGNSGDKVSDNGSVSSVVSTESSVVGSGDSSSLPDGFYKTVADVPEFDGETPFVAINGNVPTFTDEQLVTESYEFYSELDALGRCGVTIAAVGFDIMPTEDRGNIGQVKPTGWHTVKYDNVDGKYLYNRCHLIGYQLTGENANKQNLITGTRYLNIEGMLPFENMVADYVKETKNHVIYRVTPIFEGDDLLCRGVQMEGYSVEDKGEGVLFNVFAYNAQPGIFINYATGESSLSGGASSESNGSSVPEENKIEYVVNTKTKKFHLPECTSVDDIKPENKSTSTDREGFIKAGYSACKNCKP
ncbi:MAG: DNA/RNA non-specific endonuclease [Clostridia bacterium]|nr:DNA/RNA non-specific endonuclease [Clostridia bacterium]